MSKLLAPKDYILLDHCVKGRSITLTHDVYAALKLNIAFYQYKYVYPINQKKNIELFKSPAENWQDKHVTIIKKNFRHKCRVKPHKG